MTSADQVAPRRRKGGVYRGVLRRLIGGQASVAQKAQIPTEQQRNPDEKTPGFNQNKPSGARQKPAPLALSATDIPASSVWQTNTVYSPSVSNETEFKLSRSSACGSALVVGMCTFIGAAYRFTHLSNTTTLQEAGTVASPTAVRKTAAISGGDNSRRSGSESPFLQVRSAVLFDSALRSSLSLFFSLPQAQHADRTDAKHTADEQWRLSICTGTLAG